MNSDGQFTFQLDQTTIHVLNGNITQLDADVLCSSDDVYLSRGGGVSLAISQAAGENLRIDVQKQKLPLPVGSVVVTTAGRLRAKYVFHAITTDFTKLPHGDALIAHLMKDILEIGTALNVRHITLPLLGAGTAGLPKSDVLTYMLQSAMYYLYDRRLRSRELTIVTFQERDLTPLLDRFNQLFCSAKEKHAKIDALQAVCQEIQDDEVLKRSLEARMARLEGEARNTFCFDAINSGLDEDANASMTLASYHEAKKRFVDAIDQCKEESRQTEKLRRIKQERCQFLEEQKAHTGADTKPDVLMELDETEEQIGKYTAAIESIAQRQTYYETRLNSLRYA